MLQKKEKGLRKIVKRVLSLADPSVLHLSWVESHDTAIGVPDLNYCYKGVEGWIELKCGPNIDVRAAQVVWFEGRTKAGGSPTFLLQYEDVFLMVAGRWARSLRENPSYENARGHACRIWWGGLPLGEFLDSLLNKF